MTAMKPPTRSIQRVMDRLNQLRDAVPFHQHGIGLLAGECLKCGRAWPCSDYMREVGDL